MTPKIQVKSTGGITYIRNLQTYKKGDYDPSKPLFLISRLGQDRTVSLDLQLDRSTAELFIKTLNIPEKDQKLPASNPKLHPKSHLP